MSRQQKYYDLLLHNANNKKCITIQVKSSRTYLKAEKSGTKEEYNKQYFQKHYQNNKGYYRNKCVIRERNIKQASPTWANSFYMYEAYELAQLRSKVFGFLWEVDHIIPLVNKQVCGLHVEHNLQVVPAQWNKQKSNKWDCEKGVRTWLS